MFHDVRTYTFLPTFFTQCTYIQTLSLKRLGEVPCKENDGQLSEPMCGLDS